MSKSTTHRFKSEFASRIKSGLASGPILEDRAVTPDTLTDEDVPLLQQYGYGHLLEPIPTAGPEAEAAKLDQQIAELTAKRDALTLTATPTEVNSGVLLTAVEQTGTETIIKHSSGGPDDLPITAPAAAEEAVKTPDKKPEQELKPAKKDDKHK